MPDINISYLFDKSPEEIVKYFEAKGMRFSFDWRDTWKQAHAKAFTAAKVMKMDILQDIRDEVTSTIKNGSTFDEFKKNLTPKLVSKGWWGKMRAGDMPGYNSSMGDPDRQVQLGSPRRLKTIYQTNLNSAYNSGRWNQQWQNRDDRPYLEYRQIQRANKRDDHSQLHGKVFHIDDPKVQEIYPPNGYNCFPGYTEIATPAGWKQIQFIKEDDYVLGGSGKHRLVNTVFKRKFNGNLVRFITKDGSSVSTPNHRILTLRGWIRAENLKVGDVLVQIPEAFFVDNFVGNINHTDSSRCDVLMTLPVKRKSAVGDTMNSEFQFRNKNIDPVRRAVEIKNRIVAFFLKMIEKYLFTFCRCEIKIWMTRRINRIFKKFGLSQFFPYFSSRCGAIQLKFFSLFSHRFRILFSKTKTRMLMSFEILSHHLTGPYRLFNSSFVGVYPLCFNGFASLPGFDPVMFHQPHDCSVINFPTRGNHIDAEEFIEIEESEGFAGGAPLDLFDSLQSFVAWSRSHCSLREIISVDNILYNGKLYNIEVDKDETYLIRQAVVHNCGCYMRARTEDEIDKRNLIARDEQIDFTPHEGFDYNPGEAAFFPNLDKYDYEVAKQFVQGGLTGPDFNEFFAGNIKGKYPIAVIDDNLQQLFKSESKSIILDDESLASNKKENKNLSIEDYEIIPDLIDGAGLITKTDNQIIVYSKNKKQYYRLVITPENTELKLETFSYADNSDLRKAKKKEKIILNNE